MGAHDIAFGGDIMRIFIQLLSGSFRHDGANLYVYPMWIVDMLVALRRGIEGPRLNAHEAL